VKKNQIVCPCCDQQSSYEDWYSKGGDDFYPCPKCKNVCTSDEILPQIESNEGMNEQAKLDKKVALQIMKWKPHYHEGKLISFMTDNDKLLYFSEDERERDFKPSQDINHAFEVVESLRNADIYMDIQCDIEGYHLGVHIEGTQYDYHKHVSLSELPFLICEIALEAMKPKEPIPVYTAIIHRGESS